MVTIRNALDNTMRDLQKKGFGYDPKKPDIVTEVMEDSLWNSGLLAKCPPSRLLSSMVYLLGVNLGLRAGEHRLLCKSMFEIHPDGDYFVYRERSSKTNHGGLSSKNQKTKEVKVFKSSNGNRCVVDFLQTYLKLT